MSTLLLADDDERMAWVEVYELGTTSYLVYEAVEVGSDVEPDDTSGGNPSPVTYTAVASWWRPPDEPFVPAPLFEDVV